VKGTGVEPVNGKGEGNSVKPAKPKN